MNENDEAETAEEQYNDEITDEDINNLIKRTEDAETKNVKLSQAMNTMAETTKDSNFLHLQISTEELLTRLEHFYRGDYQAPNADGDLVWTTQDDTDLVTFNEFGVSAMMEIVSKYIDRNTLLSYYKEDRINEILADLGDELILFILCNHVKMGMDTYFKKTKFRMIVITTLHIIESSYRRSLHGRTLDKINETTVRGEFGTIPPASHAPQKRPGFLQRTFNR